MRFSQKQLFVILIVLFYSGSRANCHVNNTSLNCLLRANVSESCRNLEGYQSELHLLFDDVPHELHNKLYFGSIANLTASEIVKLPTNLLYFIPINKLGVLSGDRLASLLIAHQDNLLIAKKILQSVLTNQQHYDFLNFLVSMEDINDRTLDLISEIIYKWNFDVQDGKFQKLSNICGHALARLWAPYVLTRTKPLSVRLLNLLASVEQKSNDGILNKNCSQIKWKDLPKSVRRTWSFLAVNQSYPNSIKQWTVKQIARYNFLLKDFNNNELNLLPHNESSKMALQNIDFDYSQARFLFSLLMENSTLKDVRLLYPKLFLKLSPLQINQFEPEEWAHEKNTISSLGDTYLSFPAAKQIFNKIASHWLSLKVNPINGWTSDDLRHLPLLYTQSATSFLKFCNTTPSVQSLIAVDSCMLTDRQAFYLSGCSSMLLFHKNDPKLLLALKYLLKAVPVSSLINIHPQNFTYQLTSHLVSSINSYNLPMALHLLSIANPVKKNYFIEEMLKNKHNFIFEQLSPMDIPGPLFDGLKSLYSNYTERIDMLPKHLLNVILESNELLIKWTGNESTTNKGLYNGYSCNYINKLSSVEFIVSIYNYNAYLKRHGKVFPKNLQTCVAKAFVNYLKLKSHFSADLSSLVYLEAWEIKAVQGYVLTTLPVDIILNSVLRDDILYAIGRLTFPELMVASQPDKLKLIVNQYIMQVLRNGTNLSYEHLFILGNLTHFIPTIYLDFVDDFAFKILLETELFDTRICVDSVTKYKWADLIIRAFGNLEFWSTDTLSTLSDLLIVFNQDQLNSIPIMVRLNMADIIRTKYNDKIEWLPNDIPFYKACASFLGEQYINFTTSLSVLTDFYLTSAQSQLQMISSINYNHQYEEIIKSSEAKPKMVKPTILFPTLSINDVFNIFSPNNFLSQFFSGKEKPFMNTTFSTIKNNLSLTTSTMEKSNNNISSNLKMSIISESTPTVEFLNYTSNNFFISTTTLDPLKYSQNTKNLENNHSTENIMNVAIPLSNTTDHNITETSMPHFYIPDDIKSNVDDKTLFTIEDTKFNDNALNFQKNTTPLFSVYPEKTEYIKKDFTNLPLNFQNGKKVLNITKYPSNIAPNNSYILSENMNAMKNNTMNQNHKQRNKRLVEPILNSDGQISCDAFNVLGPASIISMRFDSIIRSMNDEELMNCVELLGSFDLNPDLARYIWSKTKDKTALHTYGSVLSGLSFDDIRTLDLDMNSPWSLELINLLSIYVTNHSIRKEITKQFMANSKVNMPLHLWGSFGSLICQLQPNTFKMIMNSKELFWKISPAFNTINTCDIPCMNNLASVAISTIGPSNLWKTAEVETMGIILAGINTTQWQMLLDSKPELLEGLSPNTIKCLNEQQIKMMNESHMKYLTPKAAFTLLKNHSKFLNVQSVTTLLSLVNFEITVDWQLTPIINYYKINERYENFMNYNSNINNIHAFESRSDVSINKSQLNSKATKNMLSIVIFSVIILFLL